MGLYTLGKTAAAAAIKAAVAARIQTMSDGTLVLDTNALNLWVYEQFQLVVDQDVPAQNREAARGVQATFDQFTLVARLAQAHSESNWTSQPEYPTSKRIASSGAFVSAAAAAISEADALTRAIEAEYGAITAELPGVIGEAYAGGGMRASLPPVESRIVEARYYVFTHVNDLGEESAPSPPSEMVEVDQRDTVNISIPAPPAGRNIAYWRFYRSNTGTVNAAPQFLAEGPITSLTGTDNAPSSGLGEVLQTGIWDEPPPTLRGICEVSSGIIAGFFGNTTAFCELFYLYAWPVEYQLSCAYPIIAQQSFEQTLVRLHNGGVDYITGADPAQMLARTDVSKQVCASARSVCKIDGGVVFASQDGLCLASGSGVQVLTINKILRDDWQLLEPAGMICVHNEGSIYAWSPTMPEMFALHLATGRITSIDFAVGGISAAFETGKAIYGTSGTTVYRLIAGPGTRTAVWRSKIVVLPAQAPMAWLVAESDFAPGSDPITVRWYGDGVLRHTAVLTRREPVRLPAGRYLEHEIEVSSRSRWNALTVASTLQELQGV